LAYLGCGCFLSHGLSLGLLFWCITCEDSWGFSTWNHIFCNPCPKCPYRTHDSLAGARHAKKKDHRLMSIKVKNMQNASQIPSGECSFTFCPSSVMPVIPVEYRLSIFWDFLGGMGCIPSDWTSPASCPSLTWPHWHFRRRATPPPSSSCTSARPVTKEFPKNF
jgi:hypothetical protein